MNQRVLAVGPVVLLSVFLASPCWAYVAFDHEFRDGGNSVIQPRAPSPCGLTQAAPGSTTELGPGESICIDTPGFPNTYTSNFNNNWLFKTTDPSSELKISCFPVAIQGSRNCIKDRLVISHECSWQRYCGANRPSPTTACSDWLRVTFRSDRSVQKRGFKCWISASGVANTADTTTTTSTTTTTATTTTATSDTCACGEPNRNRIVGGVSTEVNEYPWLVGLSDIGGSDRPYCGGSIINNEYIVTAAHCVLGSSASQVQILLNMWDWNNGPTRIVKRFVDRITIHPGYNSNTLNNDIALIHLRDAISFTAFPGIKPVCLPPSSADYAGKDATVTGWGTTSSGGSQPEIAREVTVPIRTQAECQAAYGNSVNQNMICAGLTQGGKDSCQGDSGGPLTVADSNGKHYLAGVVSWGSGCASPGRYGVYTDVPNYISWIQSVATTGKYCTN